jgi:hypothetical protein
MATIVIHAPWYKKNKAGQSIGKPGESHSWETFYKTGIGLGYMLYPDEVSLLNRGPSTVILLRNDKQQRRAISRLIKLVPTNKSAGNGGLRYHVHFVKNIGEEKYSYQPAEKLKENGVKVF